MGLLILLFTAVKLLTGVEQSFNLIWGVRTGRTWIRKLTDYVALIVITPILLTSASGAFLAAESNLVVRFLRDKMHLGAVVDGGMGRTAALAINSTKRASASSRLRAWLRCRSA